MRLYFTLDYSQADDHDSGNKLGLGDNENGLLHVIIATKDNVSIVKIMVTASSDMYVCHKYMYMQYYAACMGVETCQ